MLGSRHVTVHNSNKDMFLLLRTLCFSEKDRPLQNNFTFESVAARWDKFSKMKEHGCREYGSR